jgi:hypothetical protein
MEDSLEIYLELIDEMKKIDQIYKEKNKKSRDY